METETERARALGAKFFSSLHTHLYSLRVFLRRLLPLDFVHTVPVFGEKPLKEEF